MKTENIDEVESLIRKYRRVMAAKSKIDEINGEDGDCPEDFVLIAKDSKIEICLHDLKSEALDSLVSVLNEQYDKITARLREI